MNNRNRVYLDMSNQLAEQIENITKKYDKQNYNNMELQLKSNGIFHEIESMEEKIKMCEVDKHNQKLLNTEKNRL